MAHLDPQWSLRDKQTDGWQIRAEVSPRWIRVRTGGETIADSKRVLVVTESGKLPVYYFPLADVRTDLLTLSANSYTDPNKGEVEYWDLQVGGRTVEQAAWSYPNPTEESAVLRGYIAFVWKKADAWFEEEEEVFVHARDPYSRIDAIPSSRHIQVIIGGELVADSHRSVIVYETGLTPRYYLPEEDIRFEFLAPSSTSTQCPYKGHASYWSAEVNGIPYEDVVWSYTNPLPEVHEIAGLLSFYNEKVDEIRVDGVAWALNAEDRLPYGANSTSVQSNG